MAIGFEIKILSFFTICKICPHKNQVLIALALDNAVLNKQCLLKSQKN